MASRRDQIRMTDAELQDFVRRERTLIIVSWDHRKLGGTY